MNAHQDAPAVPPSTGQFVVVLEQGLSNASYGATIWWSEPMDEAQGFALLGRLITGGEPAVFKPARHGMILRVNDREYLNVSAGKITAAKQSRLTLTELVSIAH